MSDLAARLRRLEEDLKARPMRHFIYNDLPFAVFCYRPSDEWTLRRELRLLQTRLAKEDVSVHRVSLADLLWESVDRSEGMAEVSTLEARRGFAVAQSQVQDYLTDASWAPLPVLLQERLNAIPAGPGRPVAFIVRTGALAPSLYRVSKLLDQMKGRTTAPSVLFMPATSDANGVRFMGVGEAEGRGSSIHTRLYEE